MLDTHQLGEDALRRAGVFGRPSRTERDRALAGRSHPGNRRDREAAGTRTPVEYWATAGTRKAFCWSMFALINYPTRTWPGNNTALKTSRFVRCCSFG